MNNQLIQVALVVALCSNAVLLGILLVSSTSRGDFKCQNGNCQHQEYGRGESSNERHRNGNIRNEDLDISMNEQTSPTNDGLGLVRIGSKDINVIGSNVNSLPSTTTSRNDVINNSVEHDKFHSQQAITEQMIRHFYHKYFNDHSLMGMIRPDNVIDWADLFQNGLKDLQHHRNDFVQQFFQAFHGDHVFMPDGENMRPSSVLNSLRSKRSRRSDVLPELETKTNPYRQHTISPRNAPTTANNENTAIPKYGLTTAKKQNTARPKHEPAIANKRKAPKPRHGMGTGINRNTVKTKHVLSTANNRNTAQPKTANSRNGHVTTPGRRLWRRKNPGEKRFNRFNDRAMRRANRIARRRMSKGKSLINKRMRQTSGIKKIFSTLSDDQVSRMSEMMTNVLLPSLVQFENLIGSHITGMRSALINQELRLERLEHTSLEMQSQIHSPKPKDLQSDAEDNQTDGEEDKIKDDIDDTGLTSSDNITIRVQVFGNDEGSGEGEELDYQPVFISSPTHKLMNATTTTEEAASTTTTEPPTTEPPTTEAPTTTEPLTTSTTMTTTTTTVTTTPKPKHKDANYEQLFRYYASISQKVDSLHNYNILSTTEFNRARDMVVKMDDKVTELGRIHKNLKTRTTIHAHKIKELERQNSRIEASMGSALNNFERITERFDVFREDMDIFKNNIHKVNADFATYEQISDELRAADAHKAHDILDVRESVMNVESRVNGMYRVMDEGAANVRYEMSDMLKRVCTINRLIC